ncbi:MAG: tRNA 2-thiouridine(34) synthase MnmA [Candidatus Dependentiae bacterium]|nr:tRNA 2-thiouridine(34) synthase MnmA [Candidatus Dependentiae bacterium]
MKCAVLLSGGVDSSVALALLKQQGVDATAFYLKIWLEDELSFLGDCPWEEDLSFVRAVCKQQGVPVEVVPLQRAYWDQVVAHTIAEIRAGRTPNPDILCNQRIKFGAFFDVIGTAFDLVATGHYARVEKRDGRAHLLTSPDLVKDQTYFLSFLTQEQLMRALFPIGAYQKGEVRVLAEQFDLPTKARKDSQGICFLGKIPFNEFVRFHVGERPGNLVEYETGKKMGEHKGYWFFTVGQRQGIGLSGGPWYVVAKNVADNTVFISRSYFAPDKQRDSCLIGGCNWISGSLPVGEPVQVKLRHGPQRYDALLTACGADRYRVDLLNGNDHGIATGQYAAVYRDDECLGAGVIEATRPLCGGESMPPDTP